MPPITAQADRRHAQIPTQEDLTTDNVMELTSEQNMTGPSFTSPAENTCIQSLIGLLDPVLEQKAQSVAAAGPSTFFKHYHQVETGSSLSSLSPTRKPKRHGLCD